ncbi:MAG: cytochrome c peroxidase [Bacteroidota bacterium]
MVDGVAFSKGFNDGLTRRNSMPLLNLRFFPAKKMFWDMRAADLETQVLMPIQDLVEMGIPNLAELVAKLKTKAYYPELFNKAFGSADITEEKISKALSQFLRSMVALNSKYDQGFDNGHANLSVAEKAGLQKVIQLSCTECHSDFETHIAKNPIFLPFENSGENIFGFGTNNGLDLVYTDNGIGEKTNKPGDMATFKMPSLRNVELTAPYMHDGRFATLEQVLTHYQTGVKNHPNRGIQIPNNGYRAAISDQDKANIIAFLKTLTDGNIVTDPKFSNPFK